MKINGKEIFRDAHSIERPCKIYNVETKELLGIFSSTYAAAKFAGISRQFAKSCIETKCKCYKNKLGAVICFR